MTAADNEELDARELDALITRLCANAAAYDPLTKRARDERIAVLAIRALRARVAELGRFHDDLTHLLVAAEGDDLLQVVRNIIDQRDAAESQLRQAKADAERTSEENELLRLRVIHLQEQLQEPPRTETGSTFITRRNDGTA